MYAPPHYHCFEFAHSDNVFSNYTQIGLAFTLYSAEVLFNKGESVVLFFSLFKNILGQVSL
jgi:hypothetical protein